VNELFISIVTVIVLAGCQKTYNWDYDAAFANLNNRKSSDPIANLIGTLEAGDFKKSEDTIFLVYTSEELQKKVRSSTKALNLVVTFETKRLSAMEFVNDYEISKFENAFGVNYERTEIQKASFQAEEEKYQHALVRDERHAIDASIST